MLKDKKFDQKLEESEVKAIFIEKGKQKIEVELNLTEEVDSDEFLKICFEHFAKMKDFKKLIEEVKLFDY